MVDDAGFGTAVTSWLQQPVRVGIVDQADRSRADPTVFVCLGGLAGELLAGVAERRQDVGGDDTVGHH